MVTGLLLSLLTVGPPRLAVMDFDCTNAQLSPEVCDGYVDRLVARLVNAGLTVTARKNLDALKSIEAQRELLGCTEEGSSCMAQLAAALDADAIVTGAVAKPLDPYVLTLNVIRAKDAKRLIASSRTAAGDTALMSAIDEVGDRIAGQLNGQTTAPRVAFIGLTAGGAAVAVAGAVLFGLSKADAGRLKSTAPLAEGEAHLIAQRGGTLQPLGVALMSVGVPLAVAGAVLLALKVGSVEGVSLWVTPSGAALALGGTWP